MSNRQALRMAAVAFLTMVATVAAQAPPDPFGARARARTGPYDRPVISPYATLSGLQGGALLREYYRRVRPEVELRNAATRFSQSINTLERRVDTNEQLIQSRTSQIGPTGHATYFLNHAKYFGTSRR